MSSSLVHVIKRYCNHAKRLQIILEETKRNFDETNESSKTDCVSARGVDIDKRLELELLKEEEAEVLSTADKLPGIVVLGQNEFCKAQIVNEIFKLTVFPNFEKTDYNKLYHTVRFKYGESMCIKLELPGDFSLADNLECYKSPWNTIPHKDLEISESEIINSAATVATLEVSMNHQLLKHGCTLVVAANNVPFENEITKCTENISPIFVYGFQMESFSIKEIQELKILKDVSNFQPVCFVHINSEQQTQVLLANPLCIGAVHSPSLSAGIDIHKQGLERNVNTRAFKRNSESNLNRQLGDIEYKSDIIGQSQVGSLEIGDNNSILNGLNALCGQTLPSYKIGKVFVTSIPPATCNTAFKELCRIGYLTKTPGMKNISHDIVQDYYEVDSILVSDFNQFIPRFTIFSQQSMQRYLVNVVTVLNNAHVRCLHSFIVYAFDMARDILITPKKIEFAREKEDELYTSLMQITIDKGDEIRQMIENTIVESRDALLDKAFKYDFIGVDFNDKREITTPKGLKICTFQIQELILGGLHQAIAGKLVSSVDILRDSYTGTLTRCLESLEKVEEENPSNNSTTEALKQILNAAYQVEITVRSSSSIIHFLLLRMKQLVQALLWSQTPKIDDEWKKAVASDMLASLSATRLAKSISSQIKERLNKSHEAFLDGLKELQIKHSGRLDRVEDGRMKLRTVHAPRVAKIALESTSLKDLILYGMPQMGKEIGRGQYGVVYTCDSWKGHSPCAVKSVVPSDDKHWNDLALEFFYTKNIPEHERIVALHGSVIDYTYQGGTNLAVLLVMDRLQRDLYVAIKQRLDWVSRLRVAVDVVEGIRFLHSQGLVHRDIKLKNVLLDKENRGKLTDLGFCKPEAMMSGSIVGTPVHMAPELFTGQYDNSVDVYAFGILFWYICAGSVKLPQNFEHCASKDVLWTSVKKGLRPESLPLFDDECWKLMSECWEGEPSKRPLLGYVEPRLTKIYESCLNRSSGLTKTAKEFTVKSPLRLKYRIKDRKT